MSVNFIVDSDIQGNLYVQSHPTDPTDYGDGSLKIDGTAYIDTIDSSKTNQITFAKPVSLPVESDPSPPTSGKIIYFDTSGHLVEMNHVGTVTSIQTSDDAFNAYNEDVNEVQQYGTGLSPRLSVSVSCAGDCTIALFFEWDIDSSGDGINAELSLDSTVVDTFSGISLFPGSWQTVSTFKQIELTQLSHTLTLSVAALTDGSTVKTKNVRLELSSVTS
jgi:hypothetical protein